MTLKDNLQIIGMPTTCGSDQLAEYIPESNADVAQSVLDAGAIVFGKTNLPLFGKDTQTFNDLYGQTNNPWNFLSLVSYLPSTAALAGFTPGGLPVGIQIVGPYLEDLTPIQFAINLEKEIIGPYQLPKGFEG
jgi:amidase